MNTKLFFSTLLLLIFSSSLIAGGTSLKNTRPNIILVMTDDQGMGDLSCMGNQILQTPNLDAFYDRSTRFTDFQVSSTCAPTRGAMMSGQRPFEVGITHTVYQRERMALDIFTMPQALKIAGYENALFGKWHLGDEVEYLPQSRGFDEVLMHGAGGIGQKSLGDFPTNTENPYFDNTLLYNDTVVNTVGFCTDVFFQAALTWIKKKEDANTPYFCFLSLNAPHGPHYAPDDYKKRFLDQGYDDGTAARYGMIENIDDNFAVLLEKVEEWNGLENTLIIFMTDNGMSMPTIYKNGVAERAFNANLKGGKGSPNEGGTHVPAFWYWKGVLGEGVDIDGLASHIDLYKTFTELAGVTLPEQMQNLPGESLLPLLEDPEATWLDRELFLHSARWDANERDSAIFSSCAVRTQQWRFVNDTTLYDISIDPFETTNVFATYPELIDSLRSSYINWWDYTEPFLINEGLDRVYASQQPFNIRYYRQLASHGIPTLDPLTLTFGDEEEEEEDPSNLALMGTATQSSTDDEALASRAIDGNTNGALADGSVSNTNSEINAWWKLDLGTDEIIREINIYNRTDICCKDQLVNFTVEVTNSLDSTVFSKTYSTIPDSVLMINAENITGQFLKISLNGSGSLSLAEVQVYKGAKYKTSGYYQLLKSNGQTMCIYAGEDESMQVGDGVTLFTYTKDDPQTMWEEIDHENGYYSYQKLNTNFCLDAGDGGSNGQRVVITKYDPENENQQWEKEVLASGNIRLKKRDVAFVMNSGSGANVGQGINLWKSSANSGNLEWIFVPAFEAVASLTINVVESLSNQPLSGVEIILNNDTLQTGINGELIFLDLEVSSNFPYVLSKSGYNTINGNVKITKDSTLKISMDPLSSGIKADANVEFNIYPNPAEDYIIIETDKEISKVNIFSIDGRLLVSQTVFDSSTRIELPVEKQSLLFVNIVLKGGFVTTKKITVNPQ